MPDVVEDPFAAAFAQLMRDEQPAGTVEPAKTEPVTTEPTAADAPAEGEPAKMEPVATEPTAVDAPVEGEPAKETPAAEEPAKETPAAEEPAAQVSDDALLQRFASMVRRAAPAQPEPQAAPAATEEPAAEPLTADERAFVASYHKDWPDIARGEALLRRVEYQQLTAHIFQELARELGPLAEMVQTLATRTQLSDLRSTVTDYDQVREQVIGWVDQQPQYLQAAYKNVIQHGTVDEVADLITRFRRETGTEIKPAAAVATPAPTTPKRTELPPATKQAAAALAPVSSKRSSTTTAVDANDFDAAFSEFAGKL